MIDNIYDVSFCLLVFLLINLFGCTFAPMYSLYLFKEPLCRSRNLAEEEFSLFSVSYVFSFISSILCLKFPNIFQTLPYYFFQYERRVQGMGKSDISQICG